jgi:hypothetical protein
VLATSLDDPAWGAGWTAWQPHAAALIDRVIEYLDPGREKVDVDAEPVDGTLRITATLKRGDTPPGSWPVVADVRRPDGSSVTVPLTHRASRRFEGRLAANVPGRYAIRVTSRPESPDTAATGLGTAVHIVPYAAEWQRLGRDHAALGALAESGGGRMADSPARLEAFRPGGVGLLPAASVWLLAAILLLMADLLVSTFWPVGTASGRPSHPTG